MNVRQAMRCATAVSLALVFSTAYAAGDKPATDPMTGKQKATAIGATTGAVAGAVVGGPVGAVVGGVAGGVIGHQGTDAQGRVTRRPRTSCRERRLGAATRRTALNSQGYNAGAPDGVMGPNTQDAIRRFQADKNLTQTGMLDESTRNALGVSK